MLQITVNISGMACGMCEAHINEAVRNAFTVKKAKASHKTGKLEILTETAIDEAQLTKVIEKTGYQVLGIQTVPYVKKGLFSFGK